MLRRMLCNTALRAVVQGATYSSRILSGGLNVNGSRNVASFKGNKLFGNIVEAWEKREISKVLTSRNPDHFEKFQVGDAIAIRSINPYNPKRMVTFSGICIAIRNGLLGKSFIVRNQVDGVGVEQQFAFYSPLLKGVQLLRGPTRPVHRSKLYILRDRPPRESSVSAPESELTRLPKAGV